jgi:hypothetical protein
MECPICAQMTPAGPETNGICDGCVLLHRPTFVNRNSGQKYPDLEEVVALARQDEHRKVAHYWAGRLRRERSTRVWQAIQCWALLLAADRWVESWSGHNALREFVALPGDQDY